MRRKSRTAEEQAQQGTAKGLLLLALPPSFVGLRPGRGHPELHADVERTLLGCSVQSENGVRVSDPLAGGDPSGDSTLEATDTVDEPSDFPVAIDDDVSRMRRVVGGEEFRVVV